MSPEKCRSSLEEIAQPVRAAVLTYACVAPELRGEA